MLIFCTHFYYESLKWMRCPLMVNVSFHQSALISVIHSQIKSFLFVSQSKKAHKS